MPRRRTRKTEESRPAEEKVLPRLAESKDRMTLAAIHALGNMLTGTTYETLLNPPSPRGTLTSYHSKIVDEILDKVKTMLTYVWLETKRKFEKR